MRKRWSPSILILLALSIGNGFAYLWIAGRPWGLTTLRFGEPFAALTFADDGATLITTAANLSQSGSVNSALTAERAPRFQAWNLEAGRCATFEVDAKMETHSTSKVHEAKPNDPLATARLNGAAEVVASPDGAFGVWRFNGRSARATDGAVPAAWLIVNLSTGARVAYEPEIASTIGFSLNSQCCVVVTNTSSKPIRANLIRLVDGKSLPTTDLTADLNPQSRVRFGVYNGQLFKSVLGPRGGPFTIFDIQSGTTVVKQAVQSIDSSSSAVAINERHLVVSTNGTIEVRRRDDNDLLSTLVAGVSPNEFFFAADGRRLISAGLRSAFGFATYEEQNGRGGVDYYTRNFQDRPVEVFDLESRPPRKIAPESDQKQVYLVSNHRTGHFVGYTESVKERIWRLVDLANDRVSTEYDAAIKAYAISPVGDSIVVSRNSGSWRAWAVKFLRRFGYPLGSIPRWLVVRDLSLDLLDSFTGRTISPIANVGDTQEFHGFVFSQDGRKLAIMNGRDLRTIQVLDISKTLRAQIFAWCGLGVVNGLIVLGLVVRNVHRRRMLRVASRLTAEEIEQS